MPKKTRVHVVARDATIRNCLSDALGQALDCEVAAESDGFSALNAASSVQPDVIIVNAEPAGKQGGNEFLNSLPKGTHPVPVLVLGEGSEAINEGHLGGKAVCIRKPVSAKLLAEQVKIAIRTRGEFGGESVELGGYTLHPRRKCLCGRNGEDEIETEMQLTDMEVRVLQRLHANRGSFVSVETLLSEVWNYAPNVDSHTVQSHIYRIRENLRSNGFRRELIVTKPGEGYCIPE